jgi:hypothetical protein
MGLLRLGFGNHNCASPLLDPHRLSAGVYFCLRNGLSFGVGFRRRLGGHELAIGRGFVRPSPFVRFLGQKSFGVEFGRPR